MKGYRKKTSNGHIKTGRGASKKNMKISSPPLQSPSSQRMDEDSGLGGDSSFDSSVDSSPQSGMSFKRDLSCDPALIFHSFGSTCTKLPSRTKLINKSDHSKKIRLDMNEEANELPEDKSLIETCQVKQISFKNVPELMVTSQSLIIEPRTISLASFIKTSSCNEMGQAAAASVLQKNYIKVEKVKKRVRHHPLEGSFCSESSDGSIKLQLCAQPERQHRARYHTEGSRGAVKDQSGLGHPTVKLVGYDKTTTLRIFVASDDGTVSPHVFYQACKVSGKNSTPCTEEKIHGTIILEIIMQPGKDMEISCDCVGILKERNVDVEKKVKMSVSNRKKSTKCRLVFQTVVILNSGKTETLRVVSQPISCTQPPGIPEINRKSRSEASVVGDEEIFIIGKNFLKDTKVLFQEKTSYDETPSWVLAISPEKEFLQTTHLICRVPAYHDTNITSSVDVDVLVVSCGKSSDTHTFTYTPLQKDESMDYIQDRKLPKGVSPSAVEFNRLYAESGDITLPKSLSLISFEHSPKDPQVVYPITNKDRKETLKQYVPQLNQTQTVSECVTSAVVTNPQVNVTAAATASPNVSKENLVQMLKLLKNLPENIHVPIVDLISDEILKFGKSDSMKENSVLKPELFNDKFTMKSEPVSRVISPTVHPEEFSFTVADQSASNCSVQKQNADHNRLYDQVVYNSPLKLSAIGKPASMSIDQQDYLVLHELSKQNSQKKETSQRESNASISRNCELQSEQMTMGPVSATHVNSMVERILHQIPANQDHQFTSTSTINTSNSCSPIINDTNSYRLDSNKLQGSSSTVNVNNPCSLLNDIIPYSSSSSSMINCAIRTSSTPMSTREIPYSSLPVLTDANHCSSPIMSANSCSSVVMTETSNTSPIVQNITTCPVMVNSTSTASIRYDSPPVLQLENWDPLLSQVNSPSSLGLLSSSSSQNAMTSVTSDVATDMSKLFETELINYINPNCFDNV